MVFFALRLKMITHLTSSLTQDFCLVNKISFALVKPASNVLKNITNSEDVKVIKFQVIPSSIYVVFSWVEKNKKENLSMASINK